MKIGFAAISFLVVVLASFNAEARLVMKSGVDSDVRPGVRADVRPNVRPNVRPDGRLGGSATVRVEKDGFSIERLGTAEPQELKMGAINGWSMVLPPDRGFAPNVNWILQDPGSEMTMERYLEISYQQYRQLAALVLDKKVLSATEGELNVVMSNMGHEVRLFQKCIKVGRKFYIVTGTATVDQWKAYSAQLIKCVRSARVD